MERCWVLGTAVLCVLTGVMGVPAADPPPIVFAARSGVTAPGQGIPVVGRAQEGRLAVRDPDGSLRVLVDSSLPGAPEGTPLDVSDPDVSHDGMGIVFSGYSTTAGAWRIYEIRADGTALRQITRSDRSVDLSRYGAAAARFATYDDVDPCYLPDGRICFVSTRYPGVAPGSRERATNLYVVNADASGLHRITTERFGADTPAVDPGSGKVVYSRWWLTAQAVTPPPGGNSGGRPPAYYGPVRNVNNFSPTVLRGVLDADFAGVNNWSLAAVNPDGTGLTMLGGYGLNRELTMAYRPGFLADGRLIAQFIRESPTLATPGRNGLRALPAQPSIPEALGGPQSFAGDANMPDPKTAIALPDFVTPSFFYASAASLPDGRILVTGFPGSGNGAPPAAEYDVFIQEAGSAPPVRLFGESMTSELDAVPLVSRPLPPVIADRAPPLTREEAPRDVAEARAQGGTFTFKAENIFFNGPVDLRIANAPPVDRDLTIEFYMNPQREGVEKPEPGILIQSSPIGPDGKVTVELPAGVPLFEALRRPDGLLGIGRDGQAFHVGGMNYGGAGGVARCVGCHAGHSQLEVPEDPSWGNLAPSAVLTANSVRDSTRGSFATFAPELLVDRLTDPVGSEWAAGPVKNAQSDPVRVRLRWLKPIRAREVVVHGTAPGAGSFGQRDQTIRAFTVTRLHGETLLDERLHAAAADPRSTKVDLDPEIAFDTLVVSIRRADVSGLYEGEIHPALSEIEVIGKAVGEGPPTIAVIRGDTDCSGRVNLSDAIVAMGNLFQGRGRFCCEEAADANASGRLDLTDVIHVLHYLFRGLRDDSLAGRCSSVTGSPLACEQESCP